MDLANNYNVASAEGVYNSKKIIIDNTPAKVSIAFKDNSNSDTGSANNTHVNSGHTIRYTITIEDTNLLDNTGNITESTNNPAVLIAASEVYARVSGAASNSCSVSLSDTNIVSATKLTQVLSLYNCSVTNGTVTVYINTNATTDLADNKNTNKSNSLTFIVDNEKPKIDIGDPQIYESNGTTDHFNDTHMNSSHIVSYIITITDVNLLSSSTDITSSNNYAAGVLITETEISFVGTATTGCTIKSITTPSSFNLTTIIQEVRITGCNSTTEGTFGIKVNANATIDLADNKNDASDNSTLIKIDNKKPTVSLTFSSNTNNTTDYAKNNTHANSGHTIIFTATVTDTYLADTTSSSTTSNKSDIVIDSAEVVAEVYNGSTKTGSCSSIIMGTATINSAKNTMTQTITLTGCGGNGELKVYVAKDATMDLAHNYNDASADGLYNGKKIIIDNEGPQLSISLHSIKDSNNTERLNTTNTTTINDTKYAKDGYTITFKVKVTDTNLLDSTTITSSTNSNNALIVSSELTAAIYNSSGTKVGTCSVSIASITTATSKTEYEQVITVTSCKADTGKTGTGRLKLTIAANAIDDLADNRNSQTTTSSTITDTNCIIVDNTIPTINSVSTSLEVYVGDPVKSIEEITSYYGITATDTDGSGYSKPSGFYDSSRSNTISIGKYSEHYSLTSSLVNGNSVTVPLWVNNYSTILNSNSVIVNDSGTDIYYKKGNYTITFSIYDDVGNQSNSYSITLKVMPRRLTVTYLPQEKVYNGTTETFNNCNLYHIEGLMYTDSCGSVTYNNSPTGSVLNAGSYTITPTAITLSSGNTANYSITYIGGTYTIKDKNIVLVNNGYTETYDSKPFYFDNKDQYTYNGNQFAITNTYTLDSKTAPTKVTVTGGSAITVSKATSNYAISSNKVTIGGIEYTLIKTNNTVVSLKATDNSVTYSIEVFDNGTNFYIGGVKYTITSSTNITENAYTFAIGGVTYKIWFTDNVAARIVRNSDNVLLATVNDKTFSASVPYVLNYVASTRAIDKVLNTSGAQAATVTSNKFTINGIEYTINFDSAALINVLKDDGSSIAINSNNFVVNSVTYTISGDKVKKGNVQVATVDSNNQFMIEGNMYTLNYDLSRAINIKAGSTLVYTLSDFVGSDALNCVSYGLSSTTSTTTGGTCGSSSKGIVVAGTYTVTPSSFTLSTGNVANYTLVALQKATTINKKDFYIYYNGDIKMYDGVPMAFGISGNAKNYTITNLQTSDSVKTINYKIDDGSATATGTVKDVKMNGTSVDANGYKIEVSSVVIQNSLLSNANVTSSYNVIVNKNSAGTAITNYYRIDQIPLTIGFKDRENHRDYNSITTAASYFSNTELYNIKGNYNGGNKCDSKVATVMYTTSANCEYISSIETDAVDITNVGTYTINVTGFTVGGDNTVTTNYRLITSSNYRTFIEYTTNGSETSKTINSLSYNIIYRKDSVKS